VFSAVFATPVAGQEDADGPPVLLELDFEEGDELPREVNLTSGDVVEAQDIPDLPALDSAEPDNRILQFGGNVEGMLSLEQDRIWRDYAVVFDAYLGDSEFGLLVRDGGGLDVCGYMLVASAADGIIGLATTQGDDCADFDLLDYVLLDTLTDDWLTFRFEVVGEKLAVYLDDEEIIQVDDDGYGEGLFKLFSVSEDMIYFDNIVVYDMSSDDGDGGEVACTISAQRVNRRSGPGTNYPTEGQLNGSAEADGQAVGTDTYTWWRLTNDTWVRSDVVDESGDCDDLPEVEAPPPPANAGTGGTTTTTTTSGSASVILRSARTALSYMQAIGGQIDVALGGSMTVDCVAIATSYEIVINMPVYNVAGQPDTVQGGHTQYRAAIATFQEGLSSLYNNCISSTAEIPYHTWSSGRMSVNEAASQMEAAIRSLGG
jgi:hypothetical protein